MNGLSRMLLAFALSCSASASDSNESTVVSDGKTDASGILVHKVRSPYQAGTTQIRVLFPDKLESDRRYPVIYVLPVEAANEDHYGNGLLEIKKRDLHNSHSAVFVAPTFSHLPWYADHPTDPEIQQESYILKVVVPFIDKTYPVQADAAGRLLLGFSKSGWGAYSMLLRHPELFGKAAAWDAPLMMDKPGPYGSGAIFGTPENFASYQIVRLLDKRSAELQKENRLTMLGYGNFRGEHERAHALMTDLKIMHEYRDGPSRKHDWHSGWVTEAVELLTSR